MPKAEIHKLLEGKWVDGTRPKDIFSMHVMKNPSDYINDIIDGLKSENKRVQSGCAEIASLLSDMQPELLYPYLDLFLENLNAKEPVLRWEAVCSLGNLVKIDKDQKIRTAVERIAGFLDDISIVLQAHSVRALTKIAKAFPDLTPRIFDRFLASKDKFPGNRIGFLIEAMEIFVVDEKMVPRIRKFVAPYIKSDIRPVALKAKKVLRLIAES